jgi:hypothetical protein
MTIDNQKYFTRQSNQAQATTRSGDARCRATAGRANTTDSREPQAQASRHSPTFAEATECGADGDSAAFAAWWPYLSQHWNLTRPAITEAEAREYVALVAPALERAARDPDPESRWCDPFRPRDFHWWMTDDELARYARWPVGPLRGTSRRWRAQGCPLPDDWEGIHWALQAYMEAREAIEDRLDPDVGSQIDRWIADRVPEDADADREVRS